MYILPNKKAVADLVAIMFLILVVVVSVLSFQSFNNRLISSVSNDVSIDSRQVNENLKIQDIIGNDLYLYSSVEDNLSISSIKVGNDTCSFDKEVLREGLNIVKLGNCIYNKSKTRQTILVVTPKILTENIDFIKDGEVNYYFWNISSWSVCSNFCGEGIETREIFCLNNELDVVSDSLCDGDKGDISRVCSNYSSCTYSWVADDWSICSESCGNGTQTRDISCQRSNGEIVDDSYCSNVSQPITSQICSDYSTCTYDWLIGDWSSCSAPCEGGTQTRNVTCERSNGDSVNDTYCLDDKPELSQACNEGVTCDSGTVSIDWSANYYNGDSGGATGGKTINMGNANTIKFTGSITCGYIRWYVDGVQVSTVVSPTLTVEGGGSHYFQYKGVRTCSYATATVSSASYYYTS